MSNLNSYTCTPRQLRTFITDCLFAGLVPYASSSPGMGKSSIARVVAKDLNLKVIDHRLSTSAPEDLTGLPRFNEDGSAMFAPFTELFPVEGMPLPVEVEWVDGEAVVTHTYDGWLLLLDEFPSAPKSVQAAAYKLILDRMVGQKKLHERVVMMAAGNLMTDRAIVNQLSTAMQSRLVHLEMEINFEEWLYDVALAENYDPRIIAFLSQYPSKLMDFRPDHNEHTFCCPRTWGFMNALIKGNEVTEEKAPLYAGTITSGVAMEFVTFTKVFQNLVTIDQVIANPNGCNVPNDNSTKWATISTLMEGVNDLNFDALATYANRFDMTFRILFFRSVMVRQPQLRQHPAFAKAMSQLAKYLHG